MTVDTRALRAYAPLVVLLVTVGAGWIAFIRPMSVEQSRAASQLASLRQRELVLHRELNEPSPRGVDVDPAATFERLVASGNASPALVEHLARLASSARARNLLIETVEAAPATANVPTAALQRDPRFALFDTPVSHVPIRVAFDTDYASVARFLWAFRNLPTTVEIRALSIGLPPPNSDEVAGMSGHLLHVSLTLHAYSRVAAAVIQASAAGTR
jgi:hypothetical protein